MSYVPAPQLARRPIGAVSTTNTALWIVLALGLGWVVFDADLKRLWRKYQLRQPSRSAGWYVKLYSDPKGNPDRRLKMAAGPFDTQAEAADRAAAERDVWYPEVVYSKRNPLPSSRE